MSELINEARMFAIAAHEACGHKRKYTGESYWKHLERVANIVADYGGTDEMIAAAWLHDTIEDTSITEQILVEHFDWNVAILVTELTNNKAVDRKTRKALEIERFKSASGQACTIKLADILDNGRCFLRSGDEQAIETFMREKGVLINHLREGSESRLWANVNMMIADYFYYKD